MCTKCQTSRHRPLEFQTLLRFSVNKKLGRRPKRCFKRVDEDQDQVRISSLHHSARAHSPRLFTFIRVVSSGWSLISSAHPLPNQVLPGGSLSSCTRTRWTFIRVDFHQGGLYSGWSVLRVCTQGGIYCWWSVLRVVCNQDGLYFVLRVVSTEGGLYSGR